MLTGRAATGKQTKVNNGLSTQAEVSPEPSTANAVVLQTHKQLQGYWLSMGYFHKLNHNGKDQYTKVVIGTAKVTAILFSFTLQSLSW